MLNFQVKNATFDAFLLQKNYWWREIGTSGGGVIRSLGTEDVKRTRKLKIQPQAIHDQEKDYDGSFFQSLAR